MSQETTESTKETKDIALTNGNMFTMPDLPTFSEIGNLQIKVDWVVDKLIPENAITLLHGKGGIGKTWLCLELGRLVAEGELFFGFPTKKMPVYYIDFENSLPSLSERARHLGPSSMKVWSLWTNPPPPRLDSPEWEAYKHLDPGLMIFDTLRSCQTSEENSSTEMAKVIGKLKELRSLGFTIILMHHTTKNGENFRGSMAILDLCDHVLSLERVKEIGSDEEVENGDPLSPLKLSIRDKTRFVHSFKPMYFKFKEDGGGLCLAETPEEQMLKGILKLMRDLIGDGKIPNQSILFVTVKEKLGIKSKGTFVELLKKGLGRLWINSKNKKELIYYPLSEE